MLDHLSIPNDLPFPRSVFETLHTPSRKQKARSSLAELHLTDRFCLNKVEYLNLEVLGCKREKPYSKKQAYKQNLKLKKFESNSTVPSLSSKSVITNDQNISPINTDSKTFSLIQNEGEKQFQMTSPLNEKKKKFDFSLRNYPPRKRTLDVEIKKLNIENYFNNNYLPSLISIEESEISKNYHCDSKSSSYFQNEQSQSMGYNSIYRATVSPISCNQTSFNFNGSLPFQKSVPNPTKAFPKFSKYSSNNSQNTSKFDCNLLYKATNIPEILLPPSTVNLNNHSVKLTVPNMVRENPSQDEPCSKMQYINHQNFIQQTSHPMRKYSSTDESTREKKASFIERQGDWVCLRCKNLNFSFRIACNRCKLQKHDGNVYIDDYMKNLNSISQFNELFQTQASQNSFLNTLPNSIVHSNNINNNVFNSNLFSLNTSNYKNKTAGVISKDCLNLNK
jgi:hypothetical protein